MSRWEMDGLRLLAQYVRKRNTAPEPGAGPYLESLRVDGQGTIPRADPRYCVQVTVNDDPTLYRFPVPAEFNKKGYFILPAEDLPVKIPFDAVVTISIIETDRKGERVIAQSPLRYRTV